MLHKIKLKNETTLDFDTEELPLDEELVPFLNLLNENDLLIGEQFKIAYIYKNYYKDCKRILDCIRKNNKGSDAKVGLLLKALNLHHNLEIEEEEDANDIGNVLLGFYYLKVKNANKALMYYTKERYQFGIDICNYLNHIECSHPVLKALNDLNTMNFKEFESAKETLNRFYAHKGEEHKHIKIKYKILNDILYSLGLVEACSTKENLDVKRKIVENLISNEEFKKACECLNGLPSGYKNFFFGKIEHLKGNFEASKSFYKQCMSDSPINTRLYVLSQYAFERIVQENPIDLKLPLESFNDFNVYIKLQKGEPIDDLTGCSKDLINFLTISKGASEGLESCITKYNQLIDNKYIGKHIVLNNLVYFKMKRGLLFYRGDPAYNTKVTKEDVKCIEEAIELCPPELKDVLVYNKAYLTLDKTLFKQINLLQSKAMTTYLNKDLEGLKKLKLIELVACLSERHEAVQLLSNRNSLYSNLLLGKLYLDKFIENGSSIDLDMSINYFKKESKSFYAANGLGVCLALLKQYSHALKVFNVLLIDFNLALTNVANVYILTGDYEKGIRELIKCSDKQPRDLILALKDFLKVDFLILLYNEGFKDLKKIIFERLLKENRIEEAKEFKVADKKLLKMYEDCQRGNEDFKRKLKELEEYKRSKNIK